MNKLYENDPWEIWKKAVLTWMLCCKQTTNINQFINQDIAIKIAKMIQVDLKNSEIICIGNKYKLSVVASGTFVWSGSEGRQFSPCKMCLRPLVIECMHKCEGIKSSGYVEGVPIYQIELKLLHKIYSLPDYEWARDGYENKMKI